MPEGWKITVFAAPPQGEYPAAIIAAANGDVYISSDRNGVLGKNPDYGKIVRATDTDGDGVADEKKTLVKGFGWGAKHPRGADHTTNGVRMGIDVWLYVSAGDFGMPDAVGADGTRRNLRGGGVVRARPDGSEMEVHSYYVRNICDTAITPTLDLFSRDNTNDGKGWNTRFHHFIPTGDYG